MVGCSHCVCDASIATAVAVAQQAATEAPTGFDTPTLVENPGSQSVSNGIAEPAEESFADGLLEYPHYTRPALWRDAEERDWAVPDVLVSGHHEKVRAWRRGEAERLTRERRPDLWSRHAAAHRI